MNYKVIAVTTVLVILFYLLPYHYLELNAHLERYYFDNTASDEYNIDVLAKIVKTEKYVSDGYCKSQADISQKVTHIGFLKVPKCGSSTLTNLLFRFGVRNNLTIALPRKGIFLGSKAQVLPLKDNNCFDILAVHTWFSHDLYRSVLPEGSMKIAIVREPLDRTTSQVYYRKTRGMLKAVPKDKPMKYVISHREQLGLGNMTRVFGYKNSTDNFDAYLRYLNKEFDLVLVMDRFDESLVLMKRLFNWSTKDIIYQTSNANPHKLADYLDPSELRKFRIDNVFEYDIYNFFSNVFDKKVKAQTDDFQDEVDHFRLTLEIVRIFCTDSSKRNAVIIPKHTWNEQFDVTRQDCKLMNMVVSQLIDMLRKRHLNNNF